MLPDWAGQEAIGFPDNYTVGISFYSNLFAREHNYFVDEFRRQAAATPNADSGLRNPANPKKPIRYSRRNTRGIISSRQTRSVCRDRQDPHNRVDTAASL